MARVKEEISHGEYKRLQDLHRRAGKDEIQNRQAMGYRGNNVHAVWTRWHPTLRCHTNVLQTTSHYSTGIPEIQVHHYIKKAEFPASGHVKGKKYYKVTR